MTEAYVVAAVRTAGGAADLHGVGLETT